MGAVDIGIGHDDDAAVAQPGEVEAVAGAAAQRLDQILQGEKPAPGLGGQQNDANQLLDFLLAP